MTSKRNKTVDQLALEDAVDQFAEAMKRKLVRKMHEGYHGWDNLTNLQVIKGWLLGHAAQVYCELPSQAVDVANLAMMVWYHEIRKGMKDEL